MDPDCFFTGAACRGLSRGTVGEIQQCLIIKEGIYCRLGAVMAKKGDKNAARQPSRTSPALWLAPALAVLVLLFYMALYMGYIAPFLISLNYWKIGAIVIELVLIAGLVTSHALDRRTVDEECEVVKPEYIDVSEQAAPKAKAAKAAPLAKSPAAVAKTPATAAPKAAGAVASKGVPVAKAPVEETSKDGGKPEVVEYPEKTSGGIYADTHVPIGGGRFLKLRTMVARSCLLCDEQDNCYTLVRHSVSMGDFKSNIDCRDGFKSELSRV